MIVYDAEYQMYIEKDPFNFEGEPRLLTGAWVKVSQDITLTMEGDEFTDSVDFTLYPGWNLIGHPSLEEINIVGDIFENYTIFAYDGTWSSYDPDKPSNTLTKFTPGMGYWIKVE